MIGAKDFSERVMYELCRYIRCANMVLLQGFDGMTRSFALR